MVKVDQRLILKEITKEIIHPYFKKLGFKKKGVHFIKSERGIIKVFTIFSSAWNTKKKISFTFELRIIKDKKELAEARIGKLKIGTDYWYTLDKDTDVDKLKKEIAVDISGYAKPFFDAY